MTAKTSATINSFFGTRFKNKIKENKKLLIVNSVLELIGLPLIMILVLCDMYIQEKKIITDFNPEPLAIVSLIAVFISIAMGTIIALFSFRYLYSKQLVDMNCGLPLTSGQRFVADYLSGLTVYMLPAVLAAVLTVLIAAIGSAFVDTSEIWEMFSFCLASGCIVLIGMLLLYTLAVLAVTFCGSAFEAIFSVFAVNVVIPAAVACVWLLINRYDGTAYGFCDDSILYKEILNCTSPAGCVIFFERYADDVFNSISAENMYIRWLIPTLITIAIYFAAAYLLNRYRKAEWVSKPYVYKMFYYAMTTVAIFCIMTLFISSDTSIAAGIVVCAILYFILEVISKRGFKKFWQSILRFAGTITAVFLVWVLCNATNGFGIVKYVPSNFSINSVKIETSSSSNYLEISTDDENVISEVTDLHKEMIDRHLNFDSYEYDTLPNGGIRKESEFYNYTSNDITIAYSMKNGSTVMRSYVCASEQLADLFKAVYLCDDYADSEADAFAMSAYVWASDWTSDTYCKDYSDFLKSDSKGQIRITNKLLKEIDVQLIDHDEVVALHDAYKQDLLAMTEDELVNSPVYCYINEYIVRTSFKNTITLLQSINLPNAELTDENLITENTLRDYRYSDTGIYLYTDFRFISDLKSYAEYGTDYYAYESNPHETVHNGFTSTATYGRYNAYHNCPGTVSLSSLRNDKDLMKLINSATSMNFGERPAAVLIITENGSISGNMLVIPDRGNNRELAEKLFGEYFKDIQSESDETIYDGDEYNEDGYEYYEDDYGYYEEDIVSDTRYGFAD